MSTKLKILIVEDNEINLRLVKLALTNHFDIVSAITAEEALELLKEFHPKIILMDLQLPGMSGLQLAALLKKNPVTQDIIIIAITAFAMEGDAEKALKSGCDGYITKPFNVRTLVNDINYYLDRDCKSRPKGD